MDMQSAASALEKARSAVRTGDRKGAITEYCECFLTRLDDFQSDCDFIMFYRSQMEKYFAVKPNLFISLPEGEIGRAHV